jgi:hypothetical protein
VVKADGSQPRGCEFKPFTIYWMDVNNASYYIQTMKIKKIKVAKWGTPKKLLKKTLVDLHLRAKW